MWVNTFQELICPSDSPQLLNTDSKAASLPFRIAFIQAGWKSSAHFINILIIIAFISAGNGCIYVQSRAVYSLALTNIAPKFFAITSKKGGLYHRRVAHPRPHANDLLVPYVSFLTPCFWGLLAVMNLKVTGGQVFASYIIISVTIVLFVEYKLYHKTH